MSFFYDLRVLMKKLVSGLATEVSTQVQLASTCDYLPVRLAKVLKSILSLHCESHLTVANHIIVVKVKLISHDVKLFCVSRMW